MRQAKNSKKELEKLREEFRTYNHELLADSFTEEEIAAIPRRELIKTCEYCRCEQAYREDVRRRESSPEHLEFLELCKTNDINPSDTDLYEYTYRVIEVNNKGNVIFPKYDQRIDKNGNVLPYRYTSILAKYQKDADREIIRRHTTALQTERKWMHVYGEYTEKYIYELVKIEAFYGEFSRVPQTVHVDIKSSGEVRFVDKYYDSEGRLLN